MAKPVRSRPDKPRPGDAAYSQVQIRPCLCYPLTGPTFVRRRHFPFFNDNLIHKIAAFVRPLCAWIMASLWPWSGTGRVQSLSYTHPFCSILVDAEIACPPLSPTSAFLSSRCAQVAVRRVERGTAVRISRQPLCHRNCQCCCAQRGHVAGKRLCPARTGWRRRLRLRLGSCADPAGRRALQSAKARLAEVDRRAAFSVGRRGVGAAGRLSRKDDRHPAKTGHYRAFPVVAARRCRCQKNRGGIVNPAPVKVFVNTPVGVTPGRKKALTSGRACGPRWRPRNRPVLPR